MNSRRFSRVSRSHLRAMITEVLPYELPISFSSYPVFKFLDDLGFKWEDYPQMKSFSTTTKLSIPQEYRLKLLLGMGNSNSISDPQPSTDHVLRFIYTCTEPVENASSVPIRLWTRNTKGKQRELSLIHTSEMVRVASFYQHFESSIIYFCNRSRYSARHPYKVATRFPRKDQAYKKLLKWNEDNVEIFGREYIESRSYFSYRDFSFISRMFDSASYRACERKYSHLMKLDITNCFESLYTHTASWVVNGKIGAKANISGTHASYNFGDALDALFQKINHNETNGIVVGPEASRIFAEVILQEVDVRVEHTLENRFGLAYGSEYEVFRYVDDIHVFVKDPKNLLRIEESFVQHLKVFKLQLNPAKKEVTRLPWLSNLSTAKLQLSDIIDSLSEVNLKEDEFTLYFKVKKAEKAFRGVLQATGADAAEISNSTISAILNRARQTLNQVSVWKEQHGEEEFNRYAKVRVAQFCMACVNFAMFVYSTGPTESATIKLARLVSLVDDAYDHLGVPILDQITFRDTVRREVISQLGVTQGVRGFGLTAMHLIELLSYLGRPLQARELEHLMATRDIGFEDLNSVEILILIRTLLQPARESRNNWNNVDPHLVSLLKEISSQAKRIFEEAKFNKEYVTEKLVLELGLLGIPSQYSSLAEKIMGYEQGCIKKLRLPKYYDFFDWDVHKNYRRRLMAKTWSRVY